MSALQELVKSIEAELHLARRDANEVLAPIAAAMECYQRAVEEERVAKYCSDHSIRPPTLGKISSAEAADKLLAAVEALPEFHKLPEAARGGSEKSAGEVEDPGEVALDEVSAQFIRKFPELSEAAEIGKLLVFGAFAGRTKRLPGPLSKACEWIDTAGDGNRVVSNAVRRIRNGHVFAVIICDQAIQHQHAEPVVASARGQKIPIGYAGKGGNASFARALETLEGLLAR